jgi:hypothetical protein
MRSPQEMVLVDIYGLRLLRTVKISILIETGKLLTFFGLERGKNAEIGTFGVAGNYLCRAFILK